MKKIFALILISACICLVAGCQDLQMSRQMQIMMGTFVEVVSPDPHAQKIAFDEIKRIDSLVSKYSPSSEIYKLNQTGKIKASPETFYLMKRAMEFWKLSDGAFDPTVGPLLDLWGFTNRKFRVPSPEEIQNTLKKVGMDKVILNEEDNTIEFKNKGMKVDLGGIAKGYAVDCAVGKLKAAGIKSCLINAGGQIYALGDKFGKPWKVAVKNPYNKRNPRILDLTDRAASTSGNYEQYFMVGKKRYCHIFDPKTGYPVDTPIFSVTVLASDGIVADALSTTTFIVGADKSSEISQNFNNVDIFILSMLQ